MKALLSLLLAVFLLAVASRSLCNQPIGQYDTAVMSVQFANTSECYRYLGRQALGSIAGTSQDNCAASQFCYVMNLGMVTSFVGFDVVAMQFANVQSFSVSFAQEEMCESMRNQSQTLQSCVQTVECAGGVMQMNAVQYCQTGVYVGFFTSQAALGVNYAAFAAYYPQ